MTVDTLYPFSDTLTTTINADSPFTYYVRIPSWVSQGTIAVNGGAPKAVSPSNGLQAVNVAAGLTKFTLDLPADITIGAPVLPCVTRLISTERYPPPFLLPSHPAIPCRDRVPAERVRRRASRAAPLCVRHRALAETACAERAAAARGRPRVRRHDHLAVRD